MNQVHLKYIITAELLSILKAEGGVMGVDKHLQIQRLLQELPDEVDPEMLRLHLIPLLASSAEEQERLYLAFKEAVGRIEKVEAPPPTLTGIIHRSILPVVCIRKRCCVMKCTGNR